MVRYKLKLAVGPALARDIYIMLGGLIVVV